MGKGVGAGREPEPVPVVAAREACYDPSTSGRRVPYGRHYECHFPDRGRSFHPDWIDLKGAQVAAAPVKVCSVGHSGQDWCRFGIRAISAIESA